MEARSFSADRSRVLLGKVSLTCGGLSEVPQSVCHYVHVLHCACKYIRCSAASELEGRDPAEQHKEPAAWYMFDILHHI